MANHRIGMTFTPGIGWRVSQCYEGNGPVPLVRTYSDGSKELFLSSTQRYLVSWPVKPRHILHVWQNRPRRKRMQQAWREAHQPLDLVFSNGVLTEARA